VKVDLRNTSLTAPTHQINPRAVRGSSNSMTANLSEAAGILQYRGPQAGASPRMAR
jgi:hypothetical protein